MTGQSATLTLRFPIQSGTLAVFCRKFRLKRHAASLLFRKLGKISSNWDLLLYNSSKHLNSSYIMTLFVSLPIRRSQRPPSLCERRAQPLDRHEPLRPQPRLLRHLARPGRGQAQGLQRQRGGRWPLLVSGRLQGIPDTDQPGQLNSHR